MDFELSLLPVAASTAAAGLACYVIYRRLVGSKPTNDATAAAVAATTAAAAEPGLARKVLFADESYDDWQSVLSLESWDAFDAYFQAKYIDTEVFAGGATVVICDKQGVVHRRVFGDHKEDSVYCAYSVTKIVTTVACLQLRDEGKLDLDDLMSKHLAGWVDADRPAEPGVTAKPITIRHCLNHTSGLSYYIFNKPMHSALERTACKAKDKLSKPTLAELSSWIGKEGPIAFEPGQQFFYADAHNSVAAIIEQISGLDYETYLQQKIFGPLGMVDTTFLTSRAQRARYNKAPVDTKYLAPKWLLPVLPKFLHLIHDLHDKPHMVRGDGGLKGSMDDWTKLNRCLLNGGELNGVRVLSAKSVTEMCTSSVGGREMVAPFTYTANEKLSIDPASPGWGFPPEHVDTCIGKVRPYHFAGQTIGLGALVVADPKKATLVERAVGTSWWCGAASTFFGFHPTAKLGVLVYGAHWTCFGGKGASKGVPGTTRMCGFRDAINAAFQLQRKA